MTNAEKTQLLGFTPDELGAYFKTMGQPAFRAKQIFAWLHKGIGFDGMTNLPKVLRDELSQHAADIPLSLRQAFPSSKDDTVKFLYECALLFIFVRI